MAELLKQGQFMPMDVIDQCISIFAGARGFLDDVAINKVADFERALLEYFQGKGKPVRDKLVEERSFKKLEDEFKAACQDFKSGWSG